MDFGVCNAEKLRVKMLPSNDSYPLDFEHAKPAIHGGLVLSLRGFHVSYFEETKSCLSKSHNSNSNSGTR